MARRRWIASLVAGAVLTVALSSTTLAAARHRTVQMLDACDGPSFNLVIGEGACERRGGVTFDTFITQIIRLGTAPAWRFAPAHLSIEAGGVIEAANRGGEFHTFTEVAAFGGGCIPELNDLLGLTAVAECANPSLFDTTGAIPGEATETGPLAAGTHLFQCLLHPWMRTTVVVT